jgi:hypothetical protein
MEGQSEARICRSLAEFEASDGTRVLLEGLYRSIAVRQGRGRRPGAEPDHASIRLNDGVEVLLEPNWSDAARRSPEERSQFDRKRVIAEGVAHRRAPRPPQPIAYVIGPCLSPVLCIRLALEESKP